MTGEPHIYSAIASMLYHRTSLGLEGPVLGLSYSSDGRRLHLIFAWLLGKSDGELGPIHVAHDAFDVSKGQGVFDATGLNSCIALLHFLSSAHKRLIQLPKKSSPGRILWRADQVPSPASGGIGSKTKRIENWIFKVSEASARFLV
ncbi:hypothetical protein FA95DRAFT_515153 [Auriscalpium vulgare]|uniref:Uncharacterized protein n=1 Tax=Auriscalpium vulgare TaxID=40419 RepID=A0ACB8RFB2_9AGAM|nr:hypothetical protein FA95DRAFT_515153 [Auriscalpium vulgare]